MVHIVGQKETNLNVNRNFTYMYLKNSKCFAKPFFVVDFCKKHVSILQYSFSGTYKFLPKYIKIRTNKYALSTTDKSTNGVPYFMVNRISNIL